MTLCLQILFNKNKIQWASTKFVFYVNTFCSNDCFITYKINNPFH